MTGNDAGEFADVKTQLPARTRVNITYLASEDLDLRVGAARAVRDAGLVPVPHIAARRLSSEEELDRILERLSAEGLSEQVFLIGGDPRRPVGPFDSALDVIQTGALAAAGVREVGIAGYPEGHPQIADDRLMPSLMDKVAALRKQGIAPSVITQFGFDEGPILSWLEQVRKKGVDCLVRIGVPGPTNAKRLMGYARRFGVVTSAGIVRKYGSSMVNLIGNAGPEGLLERLFYAYCEDTHGRISTHFYTFGRLQDTIRWLEDYR